MFLAYQWCQTNGIPISKVAVPHYSEIGPNAFQWLKNWGVEYLTIKNDPGTARDSPWLVAGPYRRYEPRQLGSVALPVFYADFLNVPGHPEFAGQFFACVAEIAFVAALTVETVDEHRVIGGDGVDPAALGERGLGPPLVIPVPAADPLSPANA